MRFRCFRWAGGQDFEAKALLLVIPLELEIFSQDAEAKALLLVIPRVKNILTRFIYKGPIITHNKGSLKNYVD